MAFGFDPFSVLASAGIGQLLGGGGGGGGRVQASQNEQIGGINVSGTLNRKNIFAPARALEQLYALPEMQAYMNQANTVYGQALQGLYGGTSSANRQAGYQAQSSGLGRGFATQLAQNSQLQGAGQASSALAAAQLGDIYRKASAAQSIADAIISAQRASFLRRQQPSLGQQYQQAGVQAVSSIPQSLAALIPALASL